MSYTEINRDSLFRYLITDFDNKNSLASVNLEKKAATPLYNFDLNISNDHEDFINNLGQAEIPSEKDSKYVLGNLLYNGKTSDLSNNIKFDVYGFLLVLEFDDNERPRAQDFITEFYESNKNNHAELDIVDKTKEPIIIQVSDILYSDKYERGEKIRFLAYLNITVLHTNALFTSDISILYSGSKVYAAKINISRNYILSKDGDAHEESAYVPEKSDYKVSFGTLLTDDAFLNKLVKVLMDSSEEPIARLTIEFKKFNLKKELDFNISSVIVDGEISQGLTAAVTLVPLSDKYY